MNKAIQIFYLGLAVQLLCVTSAFAEGKQGWGVHAGIGPSSIRDVDGNETFSDTSFGYILGGEYRFNDHFALGLNVFGLGTGNDTIASVDTEVKVSGFGISGRIIFPVSETVELFGLIGNATYTADVEPGLGTGLFGSEAWVFGGGIDFATSEKFSLRLDGKYFRGQREETGALVTFGFAYLF